MLQVIGALTLVVGGLALTVWAAGLSWHRPWRTPRRPALGAFVLTIVVVMAVAAWPPAARAPASSGGKDRPQPAKPHAVVEPLPPQTVAPPAPPSVRKLAVSDNLPGRPPFETALYLDVLGKLPHILATSRRSTFTRDWTAPTDFMHTPFGVRLWAHSWVDAVGGPGMIAADILGIRATPPRAGECESLRVIASFGMGVPRADTTISEAWNSQPRPPNALFTQFDIRACVDSSGQFTLERE